MKRYEAILFDLDGTLLQMDQDDFLRETLPLQAKIMAPQFGMDGPSFLKALNEGVGAMIANNGKKTNVEVFYDCVQAPFGAERERIAEVFDSFYEKEFDAVGRISKKSDLAREALLCARKAANRVILSTLPVFPPSAQRTRLGWIGLRPEDFDLVTHSQNSRFCKPDPAYFQEILAKFGLNKERCLVVGNDVRDDLYAARCAGIPARLITDYRIDRPGYPLQGEKESTLAQFVEDLHNDRL